MVKLQALVLLTIVMLTGCGAEDTVVDVPCADIINGCPLPQAGLMVRFDRTPEPMRSFAIEVAWPQVQAVHARFSMVGMDMGPNHYRLLEAGPGRWRAEVMLPACVESQHDWLLTLEADGVRYRLPFRSK